MFPKRYHERNAARIRRCLHAGAGQHAVKQAAIKYNQPVFFGTNQPSMVGQPAHALVCDQRCPPAIGRDKCDGRCERMKRMPCTGRLNEVEVQLVPVAMRPTMRPPFCIARALCGRDCVASAKPNAVQHLTDSVRGSRAKVVAKGEKSGARAV